MFRRKIASGGNPLFCVDLPVSLPLVGRDDVKTVVIVGALATAWWYFVGQIGRASWEGKIHRTMSVAGSILLLFLGAISSFAMFGELRLISQEPNFGGKDVVVYVFAISLLIGSLISAAYAMVSAFRSDRNRV